MNFEFKKIFGIVLSLNCIFTNVYAMKVNNTLEFREVSRMSRDPVEIEKERIRKNGIAMVAYRNNQVGFLLYILAKHCKTLMLTKGVIRRRGISKEYRYVFPDTVESHGVKLLSVCEETEKIKQTLKNTVDDESLDNLNKTIFRLNICDRSLKNLLKSSPYNVAFKMLNTRKSKYGVAGAFERIEYVGDSDKTLYNRENIDYIGGKVCEFLLHKFEKHAVCSFTYEELNNFLVGKSVNQDSDVTFQNPVSSNLSEQSKKIGNNSLDYRIKSCNYKGATYSMNLVFASPDDQNFGKNINYNLDIPQQAQIKSISDNNLNYRLQTYNYTGPTYSINFVSTSPFNN